MWPASPHPRAPIHRTRHRGGPTPPPQEVPNERMGRRGNRDTHPPRRPGSGGGAPALFALGLRAVATATSDGLGGIHQGRPSSGWAWLLLAGVSFLVVVAAVVTALVMIVRG